MNTTLKVSHDLPLEFRIIREEHSKEFLKLVFNLYKDLIEGFISGAEDDQGYFLYKGVPYIEGGPVDILVVETDIWDHILKNLYENFIDNDSSRFFPEEFRFWEEEHFEEAEEIIATEYHIIHSGMEEDILAALAHCQLFHITEGMDLYSEPNLNFTPVVEVW